MSKEKTNDDLFCWEQVLRTHRVFRISQVFATRQTAEKLLPLYALFSAIEQICSTISDEEVARSKINWWRMEILQKLPGESLHPIVKQLTRTGAMNDLPVGSIATLLDSAESRLDSQAPADLTDLKQRCVETQQPQFELELAVCGSKSDFIGDESFNLARSGLLQLIRESEGRKEQGAYWWVPLNLLARHNVGRADLSGGSNSGEVTALMADIVTAREFWGHESAGSFTGKSEESQNMRHFFAINALYKRQLRRLDGLIPERFPAVLNKTGLGDLFRAWKSARALH